MWVEYWQNGNKNLVEYWKNFKLKLQERYQHTGELQSRFTYNENSCQEDYFTNGVKTLVITYFRNIISSKMTQ